jgi:thiol-disulfide isomerase/thioredoxin
MMKQFSLGAAVLAFLAPVIVVAGCNRGGQPPSTASAPADGTDASITVQLLKNPLDVAPFTVTDLTGKSISSADLKGKVVLVNFWATWCAPCQAEIPDLIALQAKYPDHLVVLGISEDELPPEAVKRFAEEKKINYPVAMTTPELGKQFPGIVALPTTFLLDRDGRIAQKRVGLVNAVQTEGAARALAGLSLNAKVERVDDPGKLTAESVAQISEIPGVDLARVPAAKKSEVLQALNADKCTCGCDLSVAKCRIDDPSCDVSLPVAKQIVAKYTTE